MGKRSGWGGARRGAGRKRLPEVQRQTERIQVNLTPKERRSLERLAGDESLAAYIGRLVREHLAGREE